MNNPPRPLLDTEKAELLSLLLNKRTCKQNGIDDEEVINATALIDAASIAIFEAYATVHNSGYAGKVISVVWPTDPTDHDIFVWRNGILEEAEGHTSTSRLTQR